MMGTNYYIEPKPPCECCGRPFDRLHIGKSSGGWCFSLHIIPDEGIDTLDDWRAIWSANPGRIVDEYGARIAPAEMEGIVTARAGRGSPQVWSARYLERNHAEPGPNGLLRSRQDGRHCVGHGEGTWDYIVGEFS